MDTQNYKEIARQSRLECLDLIFNAQTSHIASNFSVLDITTVLYENLHEGDEVVWSKGWAAASIYHYLAKQGKIPQEDLLKFGKEINGKIPYLGLAETTVPGVLCNGGSVGHGLPIATGMAYAKKIKGEKGNVYCIMSDGELNEGTTWESLMLARQRCNERLVVIIDSNKWQALGRTKDVINLEPLEDKFRVFGWSVARIDGHNYEQLEYAIGHHYDDSVAPRAIICDTIKGKGVSFFEDHLLYHYKHVTEDEYNRAKAELNA